jgi:hypothetical protein
VSTEVEFEFADEDPIALKTLLRDVNADNIEEVAEEGLLPLIGVVIAAAMAISALVNIIIRLTRLWSCGIIVDARTSTIRTKKDCDLPRGAVLVFASDGTKHKLYEPTETDLAKLIGSIGKLGAD